MPTYQYACTACDHAFEQVQSFTDDSLTECPECQGRLRKVFNAVGVVFKGSGFYRTDSRADAKSESAKSGSGRSGGGKSDDGGSSSGSSEKKDGTSGSNGSSSSSDTSSGGSGTAGSSSGNGSSGGSGSKSTSAA